MPDSAPSAEPRQTVLIATLGQIPAVITEAVWGLSLETPPVVPDRVIIITTTVGRTMARQHLLSPNPVYSGQSVWASMTQEIIQRVPGTTGCLRLEDDLAFLRVFTDSEGGEMDDIVTTEHNHMAADFTLRVVREFTDDPGTRVIGMQAGGRKTMVSLLHSALTLSGCDGDRLIHVLVKTPFDLPGMEPVFYYPTRHIAKYNFRGDNQKPLTWRDADLQIADVPFPRLGPVLRHAESVTGAKGLEALSTAVSGVVQEVQAAMTVPLEREQVLDRTPLLRDYAENYETLKHGRPFAGKRVLLVLHCLPNLLSFVHGLFAQGMEPSACTAFIKNYPYPQRNEITCRLRSLGITVVEGDEVLEEAAVVRFVDEHLLPDNRPIVVVEDGGYFAPVLAARPELASRVLGVVEQTTRGIDKTRRAFKAISPSFPVLSLPKATIKREFEPEHIARAVLKSIDSMIPDYLEGMTVGLLSCGSIGSRIAQELVHLGARVSVYDPAWVEDPRRTISAFKVVDDPLDVVRNCRLIIAASGSCSMDKKVIEGLLQSPYKVIYLASASSERVEFDLDALRAISIKDPVPVYHEYLALHSGSRLQLGMLYHLRGKQQIHLLADGMPVNFLGFSGMKDRAADLIMTLLFLGAIKTARGDYMGQAGVLEGIGQDQSEMDALSKEFSVGLSFNKLITATATT